MNKGNKLFAIEVFISKNNKSKTISIPRQRFEAWLKNYGRLSWGHYYSDYGGEHVQESGKYNLEDYFETKWIKNDLYDFIMLKMMDSRKIFSGIFSDPQKIAGDYSLHFNNEL